MLYSTSTALSATRTTSTHLTSSSVTSLLSTSPLDSPLPAGNVALPHSLPTPVLSKVDPNMLDFDDALDHVPAEYIHAQLAEMGDQLLHATAYAKIEVSEEVLTGDEPIPSHLRVQMPDGTLPCTHVLAVHGDDAADGEVLLVAAHGITYALSCSTLTHLARSRPIEGDDQQLPVHHLYIPSAQTFLILHAWLAGRSKEALFAKLLPDCAREIDMSDVAGMAGNQKGVILAKRIAERASAEDMAARVNMVHSLWSNMLNIGLADAALWQNVQMAWAILVGAMNIKQKMNPQEQAGGTV